ncbi:MAG: histidine phosphatase family protein [Nanoarchaeota archaeon]|nr:histidine phosphatase family protein [Nanoarchaeota archaeon]
MRTIISVRRHAEYEKKDRGDLLTLRGIEQALSIGEELREKYKPLLAIYVSDTKRAQQTASAMLHAYGNRNPVVLGVLDELMVQDPESPPEGMQHDEFLQKWLDEYWADMGPMYQTGDRLIWKIWTHPQVDGRIEMITHCPNIEAALVRLFNTSPEEIPPSVSIKDIGGHFKHGEGFELVHDSYDDVLADCNIHHKGRIIPYYRIRNVSEGLPRCR